MAPLEVDACEEADEDAAIVERCGSRRFSFSRLHTSPMPSESLSGRQRMVEVSVNFFKEAAQAKDRVADLEKELARKEATNKELQDQFERAEIRAESATLKLKTLQQQLTETSKALEDYRQLNVSLHLLSSEAELKVKSLQSETELLTTALRSSETTEAELRKELIRALHEEERVGSHVHLMASEAELTTAKQALQRKDEEMKALKAQILEIRKEVVAVQAKPAEVAHVQCKDCGELQQFYQSELHFCTHQQQELEKALAHSIAQQEALRWELMQEKRQHDELRAEHNDHMLEARREATFLRQALDRQKEGRWRYPKPKEEACRPQLPLSSPLWTPSPETKLRLQELLPDVKHVKSRTHHLHPKPATAQTAR